MLQKIAHQSLNLRRILRRLIDNLTGLLILQNCSRQFSKTCPVFLQCGLDGQDIIKTKELLLPHPFKSGFQRSDIVVNFFGSGVWELARG